MMTEKVLKRLSWKPMWVTHLGCMKGCSDYLGLEIPIDWLFGGTGHAIVINIHESLCPSGPTNWNTEMLFKLSRNLGIRISRVTGYKEDLDFEEKQQEAFDLVRKYIDSGLPCYGWELEIPEYYVIKGYTDTEYIYAGVGEGRRNWRTLGISEIGVLEVCGVSPGTPASDAKVVADAIKFALEIAKTPSKWINPEFKSGPEAYSTWIKALQSGKYNKWGAAYNAAVWHECRKYAAEFLKTAKNRLQNSSSYREEVASLLEEAAAHYAIVADNLAQVSELFPFPPKGSVSSEKRRKASEHLAAAQKAEESALETLKEILKTLV